MNQLSVLLFFKVLLFFLSLVFSSFAMEVYLIYCAIHYSVLQNESFVAILQKSMGTMIIFVMMIFSVTVTERVQHAEGSDDG